jgi:hypothetical protein
MRKLFFLLILLPSISFAESGLFTDNFEGNCSIGKKLYTPPYDWYFNGPDTQMKCSTEFAASGTQSVKSTATWPDFRTQMTLRGPIIENKRQYVNPGFVEDQDYWFGFSIYLKSWPLDESPNKSIVMGDIHERRDSCDEKKTDEPITFRIRDNFWHIKISGQNGSSACSTGYTTHFNANIVGHFRPSFSGKGVAQIWINGNLVANVQNKNIDYKTLTGQGSFMKLGIYQLGACDYGSGCSVKTRTAYYDDYTIVKGNPGEILFDKVNPNNNNSGNSSKKIPSPRNLKIIQN